MCFFFNVFNFEYVLENINLDMKRKKKKLLILCLSFYGFDGS